MCICLCQLYHLFFCIFVFFHKYLSSLLSAFFLFHLFHHFAMPVWVLFAVSFCVCVLNFTVFHTHTCLPNRLSIFKFAFISVISALILFVFFSGFFYLASMLSFCFPYGFYCTHTFELFRHCCVGFVHLNK